MLTKDSVCCSMFTSLLNNHLIMLISVVHKIINTPEYSAHALNNLRHHKGCNVR